MGMGWVLVSGWCTILLNIAYFSWGFLLSLPLLIIAITNFAAIIVVVINIIIIINFLVSIKLN